MRVQGITGGFRDSGLWVCKFKEVLDLCRTQNPKLFEYPDRGKAMISGACCVIDTQTYLLASKLFSQNL